MGYPPWRAPSRARAFAEDANVPNDTLHEKENDDELGNDTEKVGAGKGVVTVKARRVVKSLALSALVLTAMDGVVVASFASTTPALTPHRVYVASTSHFRLDFVTHSATVIDAAPAGLGGSQYTESDLLTNCPSVSSKALVSPGFARITLKRAHGAYAFSLSYSASDVNAGYPGQADTTLGSVQVRLTGKVVSASEIAGTIRLTGVPCSTSTYNYMAKIDPADTSGISPNA
jgi:hypothetical protein